MVDLSDRPAFQSSQVTSMIRGGGLDVEIANPGMATEEMILNIGPQHPSTHGVLRVVLELDGEVITRAEPVIGYMHRAAEKLAEFRDTRQTLVLMNRHDWISAFNNELGFVIAVETPRRHRRSRAGPVDPHDVRGVEPPAESPHVQRFVSVGTGGDDADLLRVP